MRGTVFPSARAPALFGFRHCFNPAVERAADLALAGRVVARLTSPLVPAPAGTSLARATNTVSTAAAALGSGEDLAVVVKQAGRRGPEDDIAKDVVVSSLATLLGLPVPPALPLAGSPGIDLAAGSVASLVPFSGAVSAEDTARTRGVTADAFSADLLRTSGEVLTAMTVFNQWVGNHDLHPGNILVGAEGDDGDAPLAFIDFHMSLERETRPPRRQGLDYVGESGDAPIPDADLAWALIDAIRSLPDKLIASLCARALSGRPEAGLRYARFLSAGRHTLGRRAATGMSLLRGKAGALTRRDMAGPVMPAHPTLAPAGLPLDGQSGQPQLSDSSLCGFVSPDDAAQAALCRLEACVRFPSGDESEALTVARQARQAVTWKIAETLRRRCGTSVVSRCETQASRHQHRRLSAVGREMTGFLPV